jgi:deoxyribonuclease V
VRLARRLHPWNLSPKAAIALQERLAPKLRLRDGPRAPRFVAAADASFDDASAYGVVVLWDAKLGRPVERHDARRRLAYPYVPGLLSFREAPVLLRAIERLSRAPDLLLVDGQGLAHPRGFGLACHLGLLLDLPTIGIAKSLLAGEHAPVPRRAGAHRPLVLRGRQVGWVLRTRTGVKPVYVSPGHRVSMSRALLLARRLRGPYRIVEPLRHADRLTRLVRRGARC